MKITATSLQLAQTRIFITLISPKITEKKTKRERAGSTAPRLAMKLFKYCGLQIKTLSLKAAWFSKIQLDIKDSNLDCIK